MTFGQSGGSVEGDNSLQNPRTRWLGFLLFFVLATASSLGAETTDIVVVHEKQQQYQIDSQFQHEGQVIVAHAGQEKVQNLPLEVKARLDYHERFVGTGASPQVVRYYDTAHAAITIDKKNTISRLDDGNRLIVNRIKSRSNQFQVASVKNILQQHELDLLRNQADPLSFSGLLSKKNVSIGQQWHPTHDSLARFLGVTRVTSSDVKLKLKEANPEELKIYILGKLKADVDDVTTSMEIMGVIKVDRKANMVSGLRLNISENRMPGQIAPGFNGKSKIDLQMSLVEGIESLSTKSLRSIANSRSIKHKLKWEAESGSFALQFEPSWKLIAADQEAAIFRYLDDGDLLAQCHLVRLDKRPADKPLLLEDFRREIAKIISVDTTARVVDADQSKTSNGLKALRITVDGVEEGVPLTWFYYNVAHADGRQVTFVFTLEKEIVKRAAPATRKLVNGFVFRTLKKSKAESAAHDAPEAPARR